MSAVGRESIKKYIQSGRAKITTSDVRKYGAVGSEKKKLSLIDVQTNKLIYLIKKYGIKTTNFLSDSIDQSFDGLENELLNIL
jgi:UDP-N-acetylglucosamine pyrophosphorylase